LFGDDVNLRYVNPDRLHSDSDDWLQACCHLQFRDAAVRAEESQDCIIKRDFLVVSTFMKIF